MAVFACATTSCSEADEPTFDKNFSRSLSDGTATVTYERTNVRLYDQSILTHGKWVEMDLSDYCGWEPTANSKLIIQDGKIWTDYKLFHLSTGPTLIGRIWRAYLYSTKQNLTLCLSRKFEIDEEKSSIRLNKREFTVDHIDKNSLRLIYISEYAWGESHQGGLHKEISYYKATESTDIPDNLLAFETEEELQRYVIDKARAHFGEVIDFNKVYAGMIEYTTPEGRFINLHDAEVRLGLIAE